MKKNKNIQFNGESGYLLIELLVSFAIAVIIISGIIALLAYTLQGNLIGEHKLKATSYAQEGMEAIVNIKDNNWNSFAGLATGTAYYPIYSGSPEVWSLVQDDNGEDVDIFNRKFLIYDVWRYDAGHAQEGQIAPDNDPNASIDPDTRRVRAEVAWEERTGPKDEILETYVSDWRVGIINWPFTFSSNYSFDTNKIEVTGGLAQLKQLTGGIVPNGDFETGDFTNWTEESGTVWEATNIDPGNGSYAATTESDSLELGVLRSDNMVSAGQEMRFMIKGYGGADELFSDDFSDGDASGWNETEGTNWSVDNYEYRAQAGGEHRSFNGDTAWTNYKIFTKARLTAGNGFGIYFRVTNIPNINAYVFQYDPGYGAFIIRKVVNGYEFSPFAVSTAPGFDWYGEDHNFEIDVSGDTFTVYMDGDPTPIVQGSDGDYASGEIGFRAWDSSNVYFDNVSVVGEGEAKNKVVLYKASDNSELMAASAPNSSSWQNVIWDLSPYAGQEVYVKAIDNSNDPTDGWLAVDYFRQTDNSGNILQGYSVDNPDITPASSENTADIVGWNGFSEVADKHGGEIYYQLSIDGGSSWLYWDGGSWSAAGASDYNVADVTNDNIDQLPTGADIAFKAFLESNGTQQVQLDNIEIIYNK